MEPAMEMPWVGSWAVEGVDVFVSERMRIQKV